MAMQDELLSVEEAGRVLGVSVSTVWRRIHSGDVPSVRLAGRRLIPSRALRSAGAQGARSEVPEFDENHPIFRLVGAGRSGGMAPGARDKHAILDDSR